MNAKFTRKIPWSFWLHLCSTDTYIVTQFVDVTVVHINTPRAHTSTQHTKWKSLCAATRQIQISWHIHFRPCFRLHRILAKSFFFTFRCLLFFVPFLSAINSFCLCWLHFFRLFIFFFLRLLLFFFLMLFTNIQFFFCCVSEINQEIFILCVFFVVVVGTQYRKVWSAFLSEVISMFKLI